MMNSAADDLAARALTDRDPLMKAHVFGAERAGPAASNVMQGVDAQERIFTSAGALEPPYSPDTLVALLEHSNSLRQNIDAYVTNIDAFGHSFEPVIELAASDATQRIANAMYIEAVRLKTGGPHIPSDFQLDALPTPEEIAARRAQLEDLMRIERSKVEAFFDFCCTDISFVTLRRRTRQDIEVIGNGYWEVLRDGTGEIAQFEYVPAFTVRILPLDPMLTEVRVRQKYTELAFETVPIRRRFRRYVQVFESRIVYFKELGDPRIMSRKTGEYFATEDELRERSRSDPHDGPATELLHFKIHNPRSAYGVPRWIGNLLAVLGSRQAEEINYLYFENKSVPPLAMLVSGGRVTESTIERIQSFIEGEIKGKKNFHKILVLEAEAPDAGGSGNNARLKIELRPLTGAQHNDALFQNYDERNLDKVGQSFRLPRLLRGDVRDFNRGTADAALAFAETQVFAPERAEFDFVINRKILPELGVRFWRFRSRSPSSIGASDLATIIKDLVIANVLTPEEARQFAGSVFNRDLKNITASWTQQPVPLTLAGLQPVEDQAAGFGEQQQQQQQRPASPEKGDVTLADLISGDGLLGLHQGRAFQRAPVGPSPAPTAKLDLAHEALRLVELRKALLDAEANAAAAEFRNAKRAELEQEQETVRVPWETWQSFFADEPTGK